MAPGTRRANRGAYTDHDDFEGLPVRQWRQEWADAEPPVQAEPTRKDDIWSVELRWGMPRDTGLLASHSQELLRAARSGRLYKRPSPAEEDEAEVDADKPDKKEDETATKGFQVKVWKQMTRNTDEAPISHLAKRRKGVVTIASKTVVAQPSGATVTRATVRRTDAAGNPYTQEITLQEGLAVDGEIIATTVVPLAAVNEQPQPTPPRNRRPPPPKKNKKLGGPGRGRKKKMVPPPAPVPGQEGAVAGAPVAPKTEAVEGENAVKQEREDSNNPDSEMADNDDDEGDDDGDDGDEGEGDEGDDNAEDQDQEMTDASPSVPPSADTTMELTAPESPLASKTQAPPNPLLAPPLNPSLSISSPKIEGSPLKNVILPSPTEPSHTQSLDAALAQQVEEAPAVEVVAEVASVAVEQPAAEEAKAAEETTVKSPEPESTPVVEMDITITDAATFIPPAEQVGDIQSPEVRSTEAQSSGFKSPEIKSPEVKSPEVKSPEVKAPEVDPAEVESTVKSPEITAAEATPTPTPAPAPAPEAPAEETKATPVVEQVEEPQPPVEEVAPQVEEDTTMADAPETEDVKEPSPTEPAHLEAPEEVKEEVVEPPVSPPKSEAAPVETVPEPSPPALPVEEAPPSEPKPKSPSPVAAAEEGPDLLAGLESALGQEHDEERAKEPSAEAIAVPEVPAAEDKVEVQAEVKEEVKDEEPKPEEITPSKEDGEAPAPATESSGTGFA
ncbi:hypothetical protein F5X68DRAFT_276040 [Plectosphaerella plurivora]|uniref:Uncharacterized protein n=1 Tax=Plectosphaerella plurivora TaxID=936078 RepID=A0A9P8VAP1_9PEZI|nr:hypothetical protein F5X68DRAFT_276040 [Plectosphaerella plurivora]